MLCFNTYSIKHAREIRKCHVAVVQQKSMMHVQCCCFVNINLDFYLFSLLSPSSLLKLSIVVIQKMRCRGNVTSHSYFFSGIQPFNGYRVCTILYQVQFFVPKRVARHRLCLQRHPAGIWRLFGLGNKKREDSGAERFTPHWYICVQRVFSVRSWHDCG